MKLERAYSILNIKAVDGEQRRLAGVASTPEIDRVGDSIDPFGMTFKNPLPLLWQHKADQPIGTATFGAPTAAGVSFDAQIARVDTPGILKDRLDEAWDSVKSRLVTGVSVGFRILNNAVEQLKGGGLRFLETEVMELSIVTIPANSSATILNVKSLDQPFLRAASRPRPVVYLRPRRPVVYL
jgi:HK97 family phage prohead protease